MLLPFIALYKDTMPREAGGRGDLDELRCHYCLFGEGNRLSDDAATDRQASGPRLEVRLTPRSLMASIGNKRPNAISENEPSSEPDYERNGELGHHVHPVCGFALASAANGFTLNIRPLVMRADLEVATLG
jgi:hypothetical protein